MTLNFDFEKNRKVADRARHGVKYGFPLPPWGSFAALSVVLGNVPLEDAANSVGLEPADLVREAQAWAYAAEVNTPNDL